LNADPSESNIQPNFRPDAFAGTASSYARYRPPYPQSLLDDLVARTTPATGGRLLDLGCGPGRVCMALREHFTEIWAVDPEREMLDEGRKLAAGIDSIRWVESRAEDLDAPAGAFDLVTAGESFHRFDQDLVCSRMRSWLKPGASVALLWQVNLWRGEQAWQKAARDVVFRYTTAGREEHAALPRTHGSFEAALRENGFIDVESHVFADPFVWTIDSMIGYLSSTSILSRRVLGSRARDLEIELRRALADQTTDGTFREDVEFGYVAGRPG
jgi:SAM-dependent methyltransferase